MSVHLRSCAFCGSTIVPGQRWVRERMPKPARGEQESSYEYYHIALASEDGSCWEKHQLMRLGSESRN